MSGATANDISKPTNGRPHARGSVAPLNSAVTGAFHRGGDLQTGCGGPMGAWVCSFWDVFTRRRRRTAAPRVLSAGWSLAKDSKGRTPGVSRYNFGLSIAGAP